MAELKPCHMCTNARVDPDLTEDTDLSYHGVGSCASNFRLMMRAGARKPVMLEVDAWLGDRWGLIGSYEPKFCPECGRELTEYRRTGDDNNYYKKQSSCTTPDGKEWFASGGGDGK